MIVDRRRAAAALSGWRVPLGLYLLAFAACLVASSAVSAAPTEPSAYYVAVARNFVEGRGLVGDALWSYATPPLLLPQPAFALWMPLPSLLAAIPMALFGPTLAAAQLAMALVGGALAPLAWAIAGEAAAAEGLTGRRAATVAIGSGLGAASFGPFLVAAAGPDSTLPFAVLAVAACWAMPRALGIAGRSGGHGGPSARAGVALGVLLGLAYLARQEALEIGLAYLCLLLPLVRRTAPAARRAWLARALGMPAVAGALVALPWLVRNALTFGSLLPGQAIQNAWLTSNDEIYSYLQPPTAAGFLAQGLAGILAHVGAGVAHDLVEVLLLPAVPVGLFGLAALVLRRRSPSMGAPTGLRALVIGGGLIFLVSVLVFPVATLAGTFRHASGPLLLALIVLSALLLDDVVARLGRGRHWQRANAWLAPLLLLFVVVPAAALEVTSTSTNAALWATRVGLAAQAAAPFLPPGGPAGSAAPAARAAVITDRPIWLADALRRPVVALPDEPPAAVAQLARAFATRLVLVVDERGRYPAAFATSGCFVELSLGALPGLPANGPPPRLFRLEEDRPCAP